MAKVAVLLTQGFSDWEYALVAGTGGPFFGLDVRFFAPESGEVCSMGGLIAHVANVVDDIPAWSPDVLVVVGGTIWETREAPDITGLLKSCHAGGGTVAGICGGTLPLGRAGLLDGVQHTSNDAGFLSDNVPDYSGSGQYCESACAVSADRVITAPGTAPVSFTASVFQAAGVDPGAVEQFRTMLAAEHQ